MFGRKKSNLQLQNEYIKSHSKSGATAFVLALLLGPLGVCYASLKTGFVLLVLALLLAPTGFGLVIVYAYGLLNASGLVRSHNSRVSLEAIAKFPS